MQHLHLMDRYIQTLDQSDMPDGGREDDMPLIGSIDTNFPHNILIVTKDDNWPEFRKTQAFHENTSQQTVYRCLEKWRKYHTPRQLRITTAEDFLSNPSNPKPHKFEEKRQTPAFQPMEILF